MVRNNGIIYKTAHSLAYFEVIICLKIRAYGCFPLDTVFLIFTYEVILTEIKICCSDSSHVFHKVPTISSEDQQLIIVDV